MADIDWRELPAKRENYSKVWAHIRQAAEAVHFDDENITRLRLGTEEAFSNITKYAYPEREGKIWFRTCIREEFFSVELIDCGGAFNPLSHDEKPEDDISLEDAEVGGLGIFFMRQSFDEINYKREIFRGQPANYLTLSLRLKKG